MLFTRRTKIGLHTYRFKQCPHCNFSSMSQATKYLTQDFVTEFIELYRLHPCLWKVKSENYFNKSKKQAAYEELLEVCKKIDENADVDFVKAKISSFRGSFRKELRKVRTSRRSGAGEEEVYVPKLWYYDLLLFTADQEIPRDSTSNLQDEQTQQENQGNSHEPDGDEENLETVLDQTRKPSTADDRPTSLKSSVQETRKRKNGGNLQRETLMKKVEKCVEREEDDFDIFGRLVASKLRKLKGQQHMLAEKQILEILYNFSLNTSTASSSRSYSPILNENLRETYVQNDSDIPSFSGEEVNRPYYFSL
ncbi:uncharacterized protein [Palaemon carinicauda]|uniref:uncharacterized protein n=1 Tax=Palaemon carinicauda TaxID=392227 RepID=UPI0035B58524